MKLETLFISLLLLLTIGCSSPATRGILDAGLGPGNCSRLALAPSHRYLVSADPQRKAITLWCLNEGNPDWTIDTAKKMGPVVVELAEWGTPVDLCFAASDTAADACYVLVDTGDGAAVVRVRISGKMSFSLPEQIDAIAGKPMDIDASTDGKSMALMASRTDVSDGRGSWNLASMTWDSSTSSWRVFESPIELDDTDRNESGLTVSAVEDGESAQKSLLEKLPVLQTHAASWGDPAVVRVSKVEEKQFHFVAYPDARIVLPVQESSTTAGDSEFKIMQEIKTGRKPSDIIVDSNRAVAVIALEGEGRIQLVDINSLRPMKTPKKSPNP